MVVVFEESAWRRRRRCLRRARGGGTINISRRCRSRSPGRERRLTSWRRGARPPPPHRGNYRLQGWRRFPSFSSSFSLPPHSLFTLPLPNPVVSSLVFPLRVWNRVSAAPHLCSSRSTGRKTVFHAALVHYYYYYRVSERALAAAEQTSSRFTCISKHRVPCRRFRWTRITCKKKFIRFPRKTVSHATRTTANTTRSFARRNYYSFGAGVSKLFKLFLFWGGVQFKGSAPPHFPTVSAGTNW